GDRPAIAQALAKKADERFPTSSALINALIKAGRTGRRESTIIPPPPPNRQTPTPAPVHTQTLRKSLPPQSAAGNAPPANLAPAPPGPRVKPPAVPPRSPAANPQPRPPAPPPAPTPAHT